MSSYLFTSLPTNNRQATSDLFTTYQNPNQIPGPVGQAAIFPISTILSLSACMIRDNISSVIAATLKGTELAFNTCMNCVTYATRGSDFVDSPDMVVSFAGKELKEKVEGIMSQLGFVKNSSGRLSYYKGRASQHAVTAVVKAGGDLDTPAPYGACNVYGYLAFNMTQKLLINVFSLFDQPIRDTDPGIGPSTAAMFAPSQVKKRYVIRQLKNIKFSGVFMPFFNGLCLPG